jgi:hypothetical protein
VKAFLIAGAALALAATPALATTTTTVSNTTPITIVDVGETTSSINVSGLGGAITDLTISIAGLSHGYPGDLVFGLLNEGAGLGLIFMSGVGQSFAISGVDLTFADWATYLPPELPADGPLVSETYLPANYEGYAFNFYTNAHDLHDFAGLSPNGRWTLYALDAVPAFAGSISGGWSLTFRTDATPDPGPGPGSAAPEPTAWAVMLLGFSLAGAAVRRRRAVRA